MSHKAKKNLRLNVAIDSINANATIAIRQDSRLYSQIYQSSGLMD